MDHDGLNSNNWIKMRTMSRRNQASSLKFCSFNRNGFRGSFTAVTGGAGFTAVTEGAGFNAVTGGGGVGFTAVTGEQFWISDDWSLITVAWMSKEVDAC